MSGGGHQTEETCQLTLGSGDTKLKRHVKQGHLTLCFKVLRRLPTNRWCFNSGLRVSMRVQQCGSQRATCRELYIYSFTQSKCLIRYCRLKKNNEEYIEPRSDTFMYKVLAAQEGVNPFQTSSQSLVATLV